MDEDPKLWRNSDRSSGRRFVYHHYQCYRISHTGVDLRQFPTPLNDRLPGFGGGDQSRPTLGMCASPSPHGSGRTPGRSSGSPTQASRASRLWSAKPIALGSTSLRHSARVMQREMPARLVSHHAAHHVCQQSLWSTHGNDKGRRTWSYVSSLHDIGGKPRRICERKDAPRWTSISATSS